MLRQQQQQVLLLLQQRDRSNSRAWQEQVAAQCSEGDREDQPLFPCKPFPSLVVLELSSSWSPSRTASKQRPLGHRLVARSGTGFSRRHVYQPSRVTNQEFINRAALGQQPGPEEEDPRNDVLTSAERAEERKHASTPSARQRGLSSQLLRSRRRAGTVLLPRRCTYELPLHQAIARRESGLQADVLVGKLKKDISFALRRGTIAY
jgi:hypothetical protein